MLFSKVKSMQRSGTEAIRTQIQPSQPKRELTKITNSENTKRTYGQPSNLKYILVHSQLKNTVNSGSVWFKQYFISMILSAVIQNVKGLAVHMVRVL